MQVTLDQLILSDDREGDLVAIGVAAPIVGGFAFDGVPTLRQPSVAAAFYGAAFATIVALFAFEKRPGTKED